MLADILALPGPEGRKYLTESGRLPHRYSYGTSSSSRQMLHDPVWANTLVDNPTIWPIIDALYGGKDWAISGAGGDLCLPGATEYQHVSPQPRQAQICTSPRADSFLQQLHRDAHPLGEAPQPMASALPERRLEVAEAKGIKIKGRAAEELSLTTMRRISEQVSALTGKVVTILVPSD